MSLALADSYVARANAYGDALVRWSVLSGIPISAAAERTHDDLLDAAYCALPADVRERVDADNAWEAWSHRTARVYAAVTNRRRYPRLYALRDGLQARWSAGTNERTPAALARWNRLREKVKALNHKIEKMEDELYQARRAELAIGRTCKALVIVAAAA